MQESSTNGPSTSSQGDSGHLAFQRLAQNLSQVGASEVEVGFLKNLMVNPVMQSLVKVQDRLEKKGVGALRPVNANCAQQGSDVELLCRKSHNSFAKELTKVLKKPFVTSLMETHDTIARNKFEGEAIEDVYKDADDNIQVAPPQLIPLEEAGIPTKAVKMVGIKKPRNQPLGITVCKDSAESPLIIARILHGSVVDKQGLLSVGDVICEINGVVVETEEALATEIINAGENITMKVVPSFNNNSIVVNGSVLKDSVVVHPLCYMRALFNYNPDEDSLLPCSEIGVHFQQGDILEVVDQRDPNWWQARVVGRLGKGPTGLIPSQELEERRKAFVKPEFDFVHKTGLCGTRVSRKKKKQMYQTKDHQEFEKAELLLYEEVVRSPPFQRKTLVLIGAPGVGRRTLKNRLLAYAQDRFDTVVPHTSRPQKEDEESGKVYHFATRATMEVEIAEHQYLEYGEAGGQLYGTKLDSVRQVMRQGKMCLLDCSPQAVKILHNSSEFMPFVVFLAAPGVEQLRFMAEYGRVMGNPNNFHRSQTFDRALRYSSRRARTMESLASVFTDDDLRRTMEESARLQRAYDKYIDLVLVNEDFDQTFRRLLEAIENLATEPQWIPVQWIY